MQTSLRQPSSYPYYDYEPNIIHDHSLEHQPMHQHQDVELTNYSDEHVHVLTYNQPHPLVLASFDPRVSATDYQAPEESACHLAPTTCAHNQSSSSFYQDQQQQHSHQFNHSANEELIVTASHDNLSSASYQAPNTSTHNTELSEASTTIPNPVYRTIYYDQVPYINESVGFENPHSYSIILDNHQHNINAVNAAGNIPDSDAILHPEPASMNLVNQVAHSAQDTDLSSLNNNLRDQQYFQAHYQAEATAEQSLNLHTSKPTNHEPEIPLRNTSYTQLDEHNQLYRMYGANDQNLDQTQVFHDLNEVRQQVDCLVDADSSGESRPLEGYEEPASKPKLEQEHPNYKDHQTYYTLSLDSTGQSSSSLTHSHESQSSAASTLSSEESCGLNRDEKRALEANIPMSYYDIVNLSIDMFNEQLARYTLTESQLNLMKDIRRRGKNKVAAQSCRKRKMEQIYELQSEVNRKATEKHSKSRELAQLIKKHNDLVQEYNRIHAIIQNHLLTKCDSIH